ncbi:GMP synthase (glutamine-hydrolyzing) [Xanthobacter flavus]|uniref:GMP synthase n=1 Tax=Xanthobacter flavus TaxID=281 RepID=A0A9W6CJ42_XANFL|nr:glutamine amidotransferase [Xanthobacter flavus]MDR6333647.1 GMP synthase (glutamine-hydrolyzing) [Xanthobacter flavus]GLI20600.1 GMP synthase [Xanthobacter flavus]
MDQPPEQGAGTLLVVLHQERSTPGRVGERLKARGFQLDVRRPALGDPLPDTFARHAGLLVFGGPMSANDESDFIHAETRLMERALAAELPTLGICLGAQIMARALGGQVAPHAEGVCEMGYYPLRATEAGAALMPWPSHVYHWHTEGFDVPPGADLLATGTVFPNQAFRAGAAWGVQFHPEVTREMMVTWIERGAHRFSRKGAQPGDAHLAGWALHDGAVVTWLDAFLATIFATGEEAGIATALDDESGI